MSGDFDPAAFEKFLDVLDQKDRAEKLGRVHAATAAAFDRPDIQKDVDPSWFDQLQSHAHALAKGSAEMVGLSPGDAAGITGAAQASTPWQNVKNAAIALGPAMGGAALAGPLLPLAALASEKLGGPRLPSSPAQAPAAVFQNAQPQAFKDASQNQQSIDDAAMTTSPSSAFTETLGPAVLTAGLGGMGRGPTGGGDPVRMPDVTSPTPGPTSLTPLQVLRNEAIHTLLPGHGLVGRAGRALARGVFGAPEPAAPPEVGPPTPHTPSPTLTAGQVIPLAEDPGAQGGNVMTSGPATRFNFPQAAQGARQAPWSAVGGAPEMPPQEPPMELAPVSEQQGQGGGGASPWSGVGGMPDMPPPGPSQAMDFPEPGGTRDFQAPPGPSGLQTERPVPQFPADFPNTDPDTYTPQQLALARQGDALSAGRLRFGDPDRHLPDYGQLSTPLEDELGSGFLSLEELEAGHRLDPRLPEDPLSPEAHSFAETVERYRAGDRESVADSPRARLRLVSGAAEARPELAADEFPVDRDLEFQARAPDRAPERWTDEFDEQFPRHTMDDKINYKQLNPNNSRLWAQAHHNGPTKAELLSLDDLKTEMRPEGEEYGAPRDHDLEFLRMQRARDGGDPPAKSLRDLRRARDNLGPEEWLQSRERTHEAWDNLRDRQGAVSIQGADGAMNPATVVKVEQYGSSGRSRNTLITVRDEVTGQEHKFATREGTYGTEDAPLVTRDADQSRPLREGEELTPYEKRWRRTKKAGRGMRYDRETNLLPYRLPEGFEEDEEE